ncbi:MAG: copper chaperone PCu(A)C [Candidatus Rokubacteria bacterium]|nr:copper chaperone PCu(A)C [Candidatus Rokubacteria bacterium]
MRIAALRGLAVLAVIALCAGCIHYPTVEEAGNARIQPQNGRVVRDADGSARFYVDLHSTGKFGDVLTGVNMALAREARLVDAAGGDRLEVPGITLVALRPGGPHVRVDGLTRALVPGEVVIVTLVFEKNGNIGVVSVVE